MGPPPPLSPPGGPPPLCGGGGRGRQGGGGAPDLAWRLMDAISVPPPLASSCGGGGGVPTSIGQGPGWHDGSESFLWQTLEDGVPHEILFKPRPVQPFSAPCGDRGLSSPAEIEALLLKQGGAYQSPDPFQCFRMRASAKERSSERFRNSFGPTDPFPTLLASDVSPFAFWYADDPAGAVSVSPRKRSVSGSWALPEGWTKYGVNGEEILSSHRYRALGNAIALPCAEYIMAGIAEVLGGGADHHF